MRIGILGPTEDEGALREAISFLFLDVDVEQIVFLGDATFLDETTGRWARELFGAGEPEFLARAVEVACTGSAEEIEALLARDDLGARLGRVRKLPPPPARAIELVDDRVVVFVHDKAVLDEEDIANAHLIVHGAGPRGELKRFGKRIFFAPGHADEGEVGVVEADDAGVSLAVFDLGGRPILREALAGAQSKLTVAS